jgi:hypothetical protein
MDRNTPRKFATTPGTRDVLPPESTRLLDMQGRIRDRFELFGFREVLTPALEYSEVIEEHGLRDVSYKVFDQDNQMLLLRPEMTTPIARLVSQRLAGSPPPHKLSYVLPNDEQFRDNFKTKQERNTQKARYLLASLETQARPANEGPMLPNSTPAGPRLHFSTSSRRTPAKSGKI